MPAITPTIRSILLRILFVIIVLVLLYTGLRDDPIPKLFYEQDKLNHMLGFAALALSARLAFPNRHWLWQALAMLGFGIGIEVFQTLEPARTGSVWDALADTVGIAIGLALSRPALRRLNYLDAHAAAADGSSAS